jgi:hypothetical protein
MTKKKFSISVPVWITYTVKADDLDQAIDEVKFRMNRNARASSSISSPRYDLMRYCEVTNK